MRQRNVKNKIEIISNSEYAILNPEDNIGNWHSIFGNDKPIYVEIGMGKGQFIYNNAIRYPNINFIGIEKSSSILALAVKKFTQNVDNLKVFGYDAKTIEKVFDHEIDKLYLNFSDPWPKKRHTKRRLMSKQFLERYDSIFKTTKVIEMKTDNRLLFEFALRSFSNYGYIIEEISIDLHQSDVQDNIMTEYEEKFHQAGKPIFYVKCVKDK